MKYDQAWLKRVQKFKQDIEKYRELVNRIPQIGDRALVKEQFGLAVSQFDQDLSRGIDTTHAEGKIADLAALALELVNNPPPFARIKDAG